MQLDPVAAAAGFRVVDHETLASTNAEALSLVRRGECGPLWVTARQQTAGRGRRGAQWVSTIGNLFATLLLRNPASPETAPQLSFVAGLAVRDAIADCSGALRGQLTLKWPNDVLYAGAKLAGILIEAETFGPALAVAIGIGVNCMTHPAATAYPATDLAAAGAEVSAGKLFAALSATMTRRLAQWQRGAGFAAIRADWVDRAAGIGGHLRVQLPDGVLQGRGEGLDEGGRLMLRLADGSVRSITAGEVFPIAASEQAARFAQPGGDE
jgi:BirA family transcriptional regulator, biotin operon repressor / biotin---[acetyl-CoA-carboxylase] ligase